MCILSWETDFGRSIGDENDNAVIFVLLGIIILALLVVLACYIFKKYRILIFKETYVGKKLKPEKKRPKKNKYSSKYKNLKF